MRTKRLLLCITAAALVVSRVSAETSLDIEQAVAAARAGNPGFARDAIEVEARQRALASSWNAWLPAASLGAGISRANSSSTGNFWSAYGSLALSLSFSPAVFEDLRRLSLRSEGAALAYEKSGRALELAVRKAFYALLLSDETVRLAEQRIARAERSFQETGAKYRAGLVPDIDVFSAQVGRDRLLPQLESARTARENSRDAFRLLLGMEAEEPFRLAGSLAGSAGSVDPGRAAEAALLAADADTVAVRSIEASLLVARSAKRSAEQAAFLPSVTFSAQTRPTVSNWTAGGTLADTGSVSLGVSWPLANLVPGSAARTSIAEADDAVRRLESQLAEARLAAATAARAAMRNLRAALSSLEALGGTVALAEKTYTLTHLAYQTGLRSLADVENAAAALDEARGDALTRSYSLLAAALDLEDSLGLPFGSLAR
jgi:outer membrane protein TolC